MWQLCKEERAEQSRDSRCNLEVWIVCCLTRHLKIDGKDPKESSTLSFCRLLSKLAGYFLIHLLWATFSNTDPPFIYFVLFISTSCHPRRCVLYFTFGVPGKWKLKEVLEVTSADVLAYHTLQITEPVYFVAVEQIQAWKDKAILDPITDLRETQCSLWQLDTNFHKMH